MKIKNGQASVVPEYRSGTQSDLDPRLRGDDIFDIVLIFAF